MERAIRALTSNNLPITTASAYACRDSSATHQPDELVAKSTQSEPDQTDAQSREELPGRHALCCSNVVLSFEK